MSFQAAMLILVASAGGAPACAFDNDSGVIAHAAAPTPQFEVAAEAWFINNKTIDFGGDTYAKYGLPRQLSPLEIEAADLLDAVPVFIEAGNYEAEIIYLMVDSADCTFQPYLRQ